MSLLLKVVAELVDPAMASLELGPCDMAESFQSRQSGPPYSPDVFLRGEPDRKTQKSYSSPFPETPRCSIAGPEM